MPQGFVGWIDPHIPLYLCGPEIEIGWRLVRAAWSRGYATEAARLSYHALSTLRLPEIIADIDAANRASVNVELKPDFG